jgi:NAD(P)-dependent dehydrogenase (short-subunit alcohol dehydrogenase family)
MEIEGKVAAITGGASGIGRATALELVRRGATGVVLADLNDERLAETKDAIEALGAKAVTVHCDVSKDADVERYRDEALAAFDDVDIVMNNAGVAMIGPAEGLSMDEWDWILQINLYGVIRGVRAFLPHLLARGSGHVVNTSSVAGLFAYAWDHPAYITAKHGVVGLT